MRLELGTLLGPYEILSAIGAGGMGEVYRARDTKLNRDVAIKVLPQSFADDPDRLARFTREAHTLASLNHQGIATIYGIEESLSTSSGHAVTRALIMELVEGDDLSRRIEGGAMSLDDALPIARQIAEALDAAHEQGVVHRDLKPANIKVRPDGTVKVLDFGLAKPLDAAGSVPNASQSPTITSPAMTRAGVILGTAAYMSPEQARGKTVDRRADIWAFGCVLFEMLSGRRAFNGEDVTDILASVLKHEPGWRDLPAATPAHVRELLRWCLQKDARERLQSIGDARILLERTAPEAPQRSRSWIAWSAAAALGAVAIAGWLRTGGAASEPSGMTLTITPPSGNQLAVVGNQGSTPEISPDGAAVMFRGRGGLYVRRLDSLESTRVPGSDTVTNAAFWSADSTTIVFPSRLSLVKVRLPDGAPETIAQLQAPTREGSWSDAGTILFATTGLWAVPASGGEAKRVEIPGLGAGRYYNPEFLPGGEDFLVVFVHDDRRDEPEVQLVTLKDGKGVDPVRLLKNPTAARYTPAGGGRLLFVRNDNLYSQKLNRAARTLEGEAELVVRGVASQPSATVNRADFSVARNGTVAWRPGKAAFSQVTIFDRQGNQTGTAGPPGSVTSVILSPDETRILAAGGDRDWLLDVGQSGRQTLPSGTNWFGWSRDGSTVLGSGSGRNLVAFSANGSGEVRDVGPVAIRGLPQDLSPDGKQVVSMVPGGRGIFVTRIEGSEDERTSRAFVEPDEAIVAPRFSPDGRWIVYRLRQTLFVQPFPGPGRRRQVTPQGGDAEWRKDGKEIVYFDRGSVMAVAVETAGAELRFGDPRHLFSGLRAPAGATAADRPLAVSRDGSRFFWPQAVEQPESNVIHIKTGWTK